MKTKKLTDKDVSRLKILERKKKVLEDNKQSILNTLNPVLEELEKIRLEEDNIYFNN